jgi:hypothetical protein
LKYKLAEIALEKKRNDEFEKEQMRIIKNGHAFAGSE